MLELHQFRHSAFCLKVRMGLAAKGMAYKIVEVTPGIGQLAIFRLSGQRQLPLIVDEENIITDSSRILRYLEVRQPEPNLIPTDPKTAAQVHLIEDWADTTLASAARTALIQAASSDPELRTELLPEDLPIAIRKVVEEAPCEFFTGMTGLFHQEEQSLMMESLEKISNLLQTNPWLVGEAITVADLAVAAQLSLLQFPESSGQILQGKGCPGFSDDPRLKPLFEWRDRIDLILLQKNSPIA